MVSVNSLVFFEVDIVSATDWPALDHFSAIQRAAARDAWNKRRMTAGRLKRLEAIAIFMELGGKHGAQAVASQVGDDKLREDR